MSRVVKPFFAFLASSLFGSLLLLSMLAFGLRFTVAEPSVVKSWLSNSGVYEKIVGEVARNMTLQQASEGSVVQVSSKELTDAAQNAFPSSELKKEGEAVVDGLYGWLKGDTTGPEFRVDFTAEKAQFAVNVATIVETKVNELPECTDVGRFSLQAFDPFQADCRPKGVDLTEELTDLATQINESEDFLSQTVFTGGDVTVYRNDTEERIGSAYPWAQRAYGVILWLPWALLAATILCLGAIIGFSSTKRKGARRAASSLFISGLSLVLSGLFLGRLLQDIIRTSIGSNESEVSITENIVNPLLEQIVDRSFARYSLYFGIGYLAVALFMYAGLLVSRGKKHSENNAPETNPQPPVPAPREEVDQSQQQEVRTAVRNDQQYSHPEPVAARGVPPLNTTPPVISARPAHPVASPTTPQHSRPQRQISRRPPMIQG